MYKIKSLYQTNVYAVNEISYIMSQDTCDETFYSTLYVIIVPVVTFYKLKRVT